MKKLFRLLVIAALLASAWYVCRVNNRYFVPYFPEEESISDIRIGAVNIDGFRIQKEPRLCANALLKLALDNRLDIILIQEFMSSDGLSTDDFRSIFKDEYPYISFKGECAIVSRLPVSAHEKVKFGDKYDYYSSAVIGGEGDNGFRVMAVHLRTTGLFKFNNGANVTSKEDAKVMLRVLKENAGFRVTQSETLAEAISESDIPVIVAGDFNCVPLAPVYRNIKACGMSDCFIEKGSGDGSTYRRLKGLFRIDYIFHDGNFTCLDCKVAQEKISDHRMVIASLRKN